jgi:hypothetical protein
MGHGIYVSLFAVGLFLGMVILLELGRRIGERRLAQDPEGAEAGLCYSRYRISAPRYHPALADLKESMK